ncbi:MAG TPA: hypothetical protein VFG09_13720 [Thermodesulfovibrionales bacterium]|jgi:hypothetical protein|nr:hypothetical protein [Thermodesulfovibrionales bacterium]
MRNEALFQYIASLSEEEREKYRSLIDETLERDRMLAETFSKMKAYTESLAENFRRLPEEALNLQMSLSALNEKLLEITETSQMISKIFRRGPVWN